MMELFGREITVSNSFRLVGVPIGIVGLSLLGRIIALACIPLDPYWDRVE